MRLIGSIIGILSLLVMLLGLIPLLGWINWFNIGFATLGLIFSSIGGSRGGKTMCLVAIIVGVLRLYMGCGVL